MSKADFLLHLDELMEEEPGTLSGEEQLNSLDGWSSLTVLGFIALMDEQFGMTVSGEDVADSKIVDDLVALAGDRIQ